MVITILMPKLSDTMSEGKVLKWVKSEGDKIKSGDVVAEIESDKATMEYENPEPGYLRKILVPAGTPGTVGAPLYLVATESPTEEIPAAALQGGGAGKTAPAAHAPAPPAPAPAAAAPAPATAPRAAAPPPPAAPTAPKASAKGTGRTIASPLAARMAGEHGLELTGIQGSGPEGRVVKRDILAAIEARKSQAAAPSRSAQAAATPQAAEKKGTGAVYRPAAPAALPQQTHEDVPLTSMRRIIGSRLVESKVQAPHFYLTVEVDMKNAMAARDQLGSISGVNVTYNDLVVKAVALGLMRHPGLNASWQGDFIRYYKSIDIGVAVALPDGLITPVVRGCQVKSLGLISAEVKELVEKAKSKRLTPDDYKGGTFTISNLGMFGVKHFTAIINPPEACILAVSAIEAVPVVENGAVVPGHRMSLTLSSDHRVVDGALAAQFLRDVKQHLENPVSLAL